MTLQFKLMVVGVVVVVGFIGQVDQLKINLCPLIKLNRLVGRWRVGGWIN